MSEIFKNQQVFRTTEEHSRFLEAALTEFNAVRVLLVSGRKSFHLSGADDFIWSALANKSVCRFCEFDPNPTLTSLLDGLETFSEFRPDSIVAIGGGSVLDMAKLINFFGTTALDPRGYLDGAVSYDGEPLLPLVAIPTTSGTGSEATHFSVLYRDKVKYSVAEQRMLPDVVILNPRLTYGMTPYQTACTGMDSFAQAIESYWAVAATEESKQYAEKSLRLSLRHLERAVNRPDDESRAGMAEAAYWAGRAINISKTTLCHALSYPMTSNYNYPHGHAVALFLPEVFRAHQDRNTVRESLLALFDTDDPVAYIDELRNAVGLTVREALDESAVEAVVSATNVERLKNNPVQFNRQELRQIVSSSLNNAKTPDDVARSG